MVASSMGVAVRAVPIEGGKAVVNKPALRASFSHFLGSC